MSDEPKPDGIDRRRFLTVLGASGVGALAVSGCSTEWGTARTEAAPRATR